MVIVGIGNLGHALANYSGFRSRGFRIVALLDADPSRHGEDVGGLDDPRLRATSRRSSPSTASRSASSRRRPTPRRTSATGMVAAGVTSILNFAPTVLSVPDGVDVRKVDLSIELQILAYHEQRKARSRPAAEPPSRRRSGRPMSVLVVGLSHKYRTRRAARAARPRRRRRSTSSCTRRRRRARHRGDRAGHLQPGRGLRRGRPLPRQRRGRLAGCCARRAGESAEELVPHLYVHYDDGAVSHLFSVACGLDSMVVGESQILGQTRDALRVGQEAGTVGPALNALFQQALRVGKRAHAETDIDRAAPSLVTAALERSAVPVGPAAGAASSSVPARWPRWPSATCPARGAAEIAVANRTAARADRLAAEYGGRAVRARRAWPTELADADVRGLVHRRDRPWSSAVDRGRTARGGARTGRWSSSTSPCRATSSPAVGRAARGHAGRPGRLAERAAPSGERGRRRRRRPRRSWPRRSPPSSPPAAPATRRPDRRRAAQRWPPRSSTPSWAAGRAAARPRRRRARRGARSTVRRVVDKLLHAADRPGQGAGRREPARSPTPPALRELFDLDPRDVPARRRVHPARRCTMRCTDRAVRLGTRRSRARHAPSPSLVADVIRERLGRDGRARRGRPPRATATAAPLASSAAPASSSARCATPCSTADVDVAVHSLKDLPTAPAERHRRSPPCPLREDPRDVAGRPRRAHPRRAARRAHGRHRLAAPASAQLRGARPRPGASSGIRGNVDTRIAQGPRRRARRGRARPRRPVPAGSARRGDRGPRPAPDAARPRARARWRSSAAPTTPTLVAALARAGRPRHPRRGHRRARRARHPRGRLLGPAGCAGRGRRGRGRRGARGCAPWPSPRTADCPCG